MAQTAKSASVEIVDYYKLKPVVIRSSDTQAGAKPYLGETPEEAKAADCNLRNGIKGAVVAESNSFSLVVVSPSEWSASCPRQAGLGNQSAVWVKNSDLSRGVRVTRRVDASLSVQPEEGGKTCRVYEGAQGAAEVRTPTHTLVRFPDNGWPCLKALGPNGTPRAWIPNEALKEDTILDYSKFGDLCSVYKALDRMPGAEVASTEATVTETCVDCQRPAGVGLVDELKKIRNSHFGNRCILEKSEDEFNSPACSFKVLLGQAKDCGTDKAGRKISCDAAKCRQNLQKMYCENSPWRDLGIEDRFRLTVDLALGASKRYGIDYRAIPCIAAVETTVLDPLTKNDLACENENMNTYHGLGMITLQTLTDYLRPNRGKIGPFRSKIPHFNRPMYYACPKLLHDSLGLSAELQIEVLAYTLREKNSNYAAYNGLPGHMEKYGAAVKKCVSCLNHRLNKNGKRIGSEDPVECLSNASRVGNMSFLMKENDQIYKDFESRRKSYCEGVK